MIQPPFESSKDLASLEGIRHGFFGRRCGRSAGDFQGLNTSETNGDDPDQVAHNRRLAQTALGVGAFPLAGLSQVHGSSVVTLKEVPLPGVRPEADGMVTALSGVALAIITADCCPILLADPSAKVIGAAHAGWRGAVGGVVEATVQAMAALGARPEQIVAVIGPSISAKNYEISPEMGAELAATDPLAAASLVATSNGRPHFDLPGYTVRLLSAAGVGRVEMVGGCTYTQFGRYYSHRYATHRGEKAGRQISIVAQV